MKKILTIIASIILFSSCATVFTGSKKRVIFDGNVDEPVNLTIDGYRVNKVTFPYVHKIKGGFNITIVKAELDGYERSTLMIDKNFNPVSVLNLCGLFFWGIDVATGAIMKPEYKYYEFDFKKKEVKENQ